MIIDYRFAVVALKTATMIIVAFKLLFAVVALETASIILAFKLLGRCEMLRTISTFADILLPVVALETATMAFKLLGRCEMLRMLLLITAKRGLTVCADSTKVPSYKTRDYREPEMESRGGWETARAERSEKRIGRRFDEGA
nr:hypothetical protein Iba_chr11dCG5190 [Ipomoea batatas]